MRTRTGRVLTSLAALALVAVACGDDDAADESADTTVAPETTEVTETTSAPESTEAPRTTAAPEPETPMGPAAIVADDQESDGTSMVVASVSLPASGFVAVHGDGGGSPGAVIGHSDLLPAGESADVTVTFDEPLAASGVVFPMVHIDVDGDGVYEFEPPDETTDGPGVTADGAVAVVPATITVVAAVGLRLADTDLGSVIVDRAGLTVYLFLPDEQSDSTCYGPCEQAWPVVGEITSVGDGLDAALLGSIERTTGDVQATYNGWPLYYFIDDGAPGDTNGQGVNDVWFVVDAAGNSVRGE